MPEPNPQNRCQHPNSRGRQCRSLRAPDHPSFCRYHARDAGATPKPQDPTLFLEIFGPVKEFYHAASIHHVIGNILVLQAEDRIPPRKASVMVYTCQLLLQSLSKVHDELCGVRPELIKVLREMNNDLKIYEFPPSSTGKESDATAATPVKPPEQATAPPPQTDSAPGTSRVFRSR